MNRQSSYTVTNDVDLSDSHHGSENSPESEENTDPGKNIFKYQVSVTVAMVMVWIANGMSAAMTGTTLPDQRDRLGVSTEQMATIYAAAGLVGLFANLFNGLITDMFETRAMFIMSIYLMIAAVVIVVQKFLVSYWLYFFMVQVFVFLMCSCDATGNIVILRIWGERSPGPLQAIHTGYYIGGILGPFIARPFLSPDTEAPVNCTDLVTITTCGDTVPVFTESPSRYPEGSRIQIAFLAPGIMFVIASLSLLTMFINGKKNGYQMKSSSINGEKKSLKEILNPASCASGSTYYAVFFLATFGLFYFFHMAKSMPLGNYMFTFATESDLAFAKSDAALLDGIYYASGFAGRLVSIVISKWFRIQLLLNAEVAITMLLAIYLALYGVNAQLSFAITVSVISFVNSPVWPGCIAWTDQYITLTATAYFLLPVGASSASMIFHPIYGSYLDNGKYDVIMYGIALFGILTFMLTVFRQIIGTIHGDRFGKDVKSDTEIEHIEIVKCNRDESAFNSYI